MGTRINGPHGVWGSGSSSKTQEALVSNHSTLERMKRLLSVPPRNMQWSQMDL
jgi:hypothetical protein